MRCHSRRSPLTFGSPSPQLRDLTCILWTWRVCAGKRFAGTDPSRSINTWRSFVQRYRDLSSFSWRGLKKSYSPQDPLCCLLLRLLLLLEQGHWVLALILGPTSRPRWWLRDFEFSNLEDLEVVALKTIKATLLNSWFQPKLDNSFANLVEYRIHGTLRSTTMLDILNGRLGTVRDASWLVTMSRSTSWPLPKAKHLSFGFLTFNTYDCISKRQSNTPSTKTPGWWTPDTTGARLNLTPILSSPWSMRMGIRTRFLWLPKN